MRMALPKRQLPPRKRKCRSSPTFWSTGERLSSRLPVASESVTSTGSQSADGLPPRVLSALDAYLAESHSRLLVVKPLRDERQKESTQRARATLVMECFDPPEDPTQLASRLEIIARHATPATDAVLYRSPADIPVDLGVS